MPRHVRIPATEAWLLGLGLCIPLLLIPHATNVRPGNLLFGLPPDYLRILYEYWLTSPWTVPARQLLLLGAVRMHGCLGPHFWLRTRGWPARCGRCATWAWRRCCRPASPCGFCPPSTRARANRR